MSIITERFKIENESLINFEKKVFPRISYEGELHAELAYRLRDPEMAKSIYSAYANLAPSLNEEEKSSFEKALLGTCYLFGSTKYSCHLGFRLALQEEGFPFEKHCLKAFMEEANRDLYPRMPKNGDLIRHIVITTTSAAGGNWAVAEGLKSVLEKNCKVTVIDIEKFSSELDPIKIATGTHTTDKIYAEFIQQKNQFNEGFELMMNTTRQVARFIEPTLGRVLKQHVANLNPDFLISTLNGHDIDLALTSSLSIPGALIHCDCELGYYMKDLIGKINSDLFKIWLPESHARVFKPIFKDWEDYKNEPWDVFKKALAESLHISEESLDAQIAFVGAPTKPSIHKIRDLEPVKEKWGLKSDEKAVLVTLGQNGVGELKKIFEELIQSDKSSTHYYFVCGSNQELKEELEKKALGQFHILGLASGETMNELLNISSLVIGKPGGSQKEECLKLGVPLMVVFMHDLWESGNFAKLEREGYLVPYDKEKGIAEQVEAYLKQPKPEKAKRLKWKQLVPLFTK